MGTQARPAHYYDITVSYAGDEEEHTVLIPAGTREDQDLLAQETSDAAAKNFVLRCVAGDTGTFRASVTMIDAYNVWPRRWITVDIPSDEATQ